MHQLSYFHALVSICSLRVFTITCGHFPLTLTTSSSFLCPWNLWTATLESVLLHSMSSHLVHVAFFTVVCQIFFTQFTSKYSHKFPVFQFHSIQITWTIFHSFQFSTNPMLLSWCLGLDWLKLRFCTSPIFLCSKLALEPLNFSRG